MSVVQVVECGTVDATCEFLVGHITVSQLAQYAHSTRVDLPTLRWFTQLALSVPDVYNRVIVLKVLPGCLLEQLHNRLRTLIQQQPVLHSTLNAEGQSLVCNPNVCYPNEVLAGYSMAQWTLVEMVAQYNSMLDVTDGRVFAAALLHALQPASNTLILCTYYLYVDMHSWCLVPSTLDATSTVDDTNNSGPRRRNDYLASETVDSVIHES